MILNSTNYKRLLLLKIQKENDRIEWDQLRYQEREKRYSQRGEYRVKNLKLSKKTKYWNSSQKSEKNQDLEEGWIRSKNSWRRLEDQDDQASTDWDGFLIHQVFLNSICISIFTIFVFIFSNLLQAVYQLWFNLVCLLDLDLGSCESAVEAVN